jgi:BirA family biotin operon repressor/biotin-[acetyl-CoA-carboxylase] ligase
MFENNNIKSTLQNNTFSTLFVGQNLIKLTRVDSTNTYLKIMASKSAPLAEGTVIMAEDQYAGRGQQDMVWIAEPKKNLTFSLLLKPGFLKINEQFILNMLVCIAIKDALHKYLKTQVFIKWPNDIYFNDQKLGGILIENLLSGTAYKSAIIGIGLNVNQQKFDDQLNSRATSLRQILQADVNLIQLLAEICSHIESGYLKLKAGNYKDLKQAYLSNLLNFETNAWFRQGDQVFEGKITGVTEAGLLVISSNGIEREYNFKEIQYINRQL